MADAQPRVLVVDDERFFREAIEEALAEAGIDCDAVSSGAEALEAALDPEVEVVVLDVTLADLSGIEVLRRLRAERPSLRVIVLSAHTDQELVLEALRLDASDYLAKPLHDEELVLAVRRALSAYDVESSWQRLRERVRRLETRSGDLAHWPAARADDVEGFAELAADAAGEVLGASKTSVMLLDAEANELRVVAATGSALEATQMDPVALGEGVAGVALSLGEAVIVDDVYTDTRFSGRSLHDRYETSSLAVVPLRTRERMLGVICATDRVGGVPFGDDELALLRILALPVTSFLAKASEAPAAGPAQEAPAEPGAAPEPEPPADAAAPASAADAELAREICEAMILELEPARLLDRALAAVARRLGGDGAALHLIDNATGELVLEHQNEASVEDRVRLPRNRGLTGVVLQAGTLVATDHPERFPRSDAVGAAAADGEPRPFLCVPLSLRGKVLGAFRAFPEAGADGAARTGELLAATLSAAVRNVLLYRSLLESIDEVAEARREAGGSEARWRS